MAKSKGIKSKRKTKTVPYDVAEQLRTPEEMAAYLDAWFEEAPRGLSGCGCTRWPRSRSAEYASISRIDLGPPDLRDARGHRQRNCTALHS